MSRSSSPRVSEKQGPGEWLKYKAFRDNAILANLLMLMGYLRSVATFPVATLFAVHADRAKCEKESVNSAAARTSNTSTRPAVLVPQ